jgi:hypothetical protein
MFTREEIEEYKTRLWLAGSYYSAGIIDQLLRELAGRDAAIQQLNERITILRRRLEEQEKPHQSYPNLSLEG